MKTPPLGWIRPDERTQTMWDVHEIAVKNMRQPFRIAGHGEDPGPYLNLIELWRNPEVVTALGYEFSGIHQITGSCVGAGGGNAIFSMACVEVIRLNDPEQIVIPFWLFTYGKSRELLGDRTEGEGSLGSTFAEAAKRFGVFSNTEDGLPQPQNTDGLIWGEAVEMKWSNGIAIPAKWLDVGRKHLVKTVAPLKSSADVKASLQNLYPVTFACDYYMGPNGARVRGSSDNKACVGTLNTFGGHQTTLQGYWEHPELGLLFWNENQWDRNTYPVDPKTGRASGVWMPASEVDRAIRGMNAEVYGWSQYDGYPAQKIKIDWSGLGTW